MRKRKKFFIVVAILGLTVISGIAFSMFGTGMDVFNTKKFYAGTIVNGTDVSGMTVEEVSNLIATQLISSRSEASLTLTYQDKSWTWKGEDFEPNNEIYPAVEEVFSYGRNGGFLQRNNVIKQIKKQGYNVTIPVSYVLGGIDEKIDSVALEIEKPAINAEVSFDPSQEGPFTYKKEQTGIIVDKELLKNEINTAFISSNQVSLEIPTIQQQPEIKEADLKSKIAKRSSFKTSIASSKADRKHNVKQALKAFNGMIVEPGQEISFNTTTGSRTAENGYKKANIILNGVYVEGTGGGVCQASTTLYNALILSDLEILEVNPHSLPASYVPLAFDAMVSEGYSDLVFRNNTQSSIYIKTWGDDKNVGVEIYGEPFEEGLTIVRKADFVEVLKHPGDRIVKDVEKLYSNKVTYEGEYLRLKYPQEGYHSKAYLQYYKNGELIEERLLRDEIYKAQEGIIIEGTEKLTEGMTLPENDVRFIPPQISSNTSKDSVNGKIEKQNPSGYNP